MRHAVPSLPSLVTAGVLLSYCGVLPAHEGAATSSCGCSTTDATTAPSTTTATTASTLADLAGRLHASVGLYGTAITSSASDAELSQLNQGGHDPNQSGLQFQQAEVSLSAQLSTNWYATTHWAIRTESLETEEAYVHGNNLAGAWSLRAIYFPVEIGVNNLEHPHDWLWLGRHPSTTRVFGGDAPRGAGIRVGWRPWSEAGVMAGVFQSDDASQSIWRGQGHDHGPDDGHNHDHSLGGWEQQPVDRDASRDLSDQVVQVRAEMWPQWGSSQLRFGISGAWGPNATGTDTETTVGNVFGSWSWQRWQLRSEWSVRHATTPGDTMIDWGWATEARYQPHDDWQLGLLIDVMSGSGNSADDRDRNDDVARDDRWRVSPVAAWQFTDGLRARAQVNVDHTQFHDETYWTFLLGLEAYFGKHLHVSRY